MPTMPSAPPASGSTATGAHRNEVLLTGRLSGEAEERTLPSGDVVVTWRLVVERPVAPGNGDAARAGVDTIDCAGWRADVRRSALSWQPGDTVEISGALRRRFWRSPTGPASRSEVEVARARRVRRAG